MLKTSVKSLFLVAVIFCNCMFGKSAEALFNQGMKLAEAGKTKQAFASFKAAVKQAPDSARYYFAAAQTSPDQNAALMYTKFAWEKGLKNHTVFTMLLQRSFHVDKEKKLSYALSLFGELPDSLATPMLKGELFFQFDKPDSALVVWKTEFEKTRKSFLCPKIAMCIARTGKPEEAIDFLYKCKAEKVLDSDGYTYLLSLLAMHYDFSNVELLFSELKGGSYFDDNMRLAYASYFAFNDKFDEAQKLIEKPAGPGSALQRSIINVRLRLLQIYVARALQKPFEPLLKTDDSDTLLGNRKKELFEAIGHYLKNDSISFETLQKAMAPFPPDPVTTLFLAGAAVKQKNFKLASELYATLPGIVLWSPRMVVTRAQILSLAGEDDKALTVISFMHKKRIFTRPSLELFRNLTLKKELFEKSNAAQQLLEKQYSNDIGLKWKGLLLAIKNEKYDSALVIADDLSARYPNDERIALTGLTLLLLKKEYRKVLDKTANSNLPAAKIKPIEASAYKGMGDTAKAILAYESAVKEKKDPLVVMQLAELYFKEKRYDKATSLYTQLIEEQADSSKDSVQLAVMLNNNAWTLVSAGTEDLSGALTMIKKAYEIAPDNLHIIDTYASILYESKKYKDCIKLLEKNVEALKQKRIVCHLARSFEKLNNDNKAKRYYEDALVLKKEDQKLPLMLSDGQIQGEIKRLSQK